MANAGDGSISRQFSLTADCERSRKFGVSPEQLKEAMQAVGPIAEDVRRHLGK